MITVKKMNFGYGKKRQLFSDLDMHLEGGNIYGLLGKNGAGKTTFLKIISGLRYPTNGVVNVLGVNPADRKPSFYNRLCFIPENLYVPPISASLYLSLYSPFYPDFNSKKFEKYSKDFELDLEAGKLSEMSHGQKKKFLLAFGMATQASVLILDEPTNGLDIPSKSVFRRLVAGLADEKRVIIISTHQVRDVENLIDPIVVLENGKIIFNQSVESLLSKVSFTHTKKLPEGINEIYHEKVMGGYMVCAEGSGLFNDTDLDFEFLFNTIVNNKEKIQKLFGGDSNGKK